VQTNNNNETSPPRRGNVVKTFRKFEISSDDDEEDESDYKRGGYHPVQLGNVFHQKYKIKSKLGWGHFSTVWLAEDCMRERDVAIKIVKSAKHYTEAARDEVEILTKIAQNDPNNEKCVLQLLDHFDIYGPNGTHVAMVFETLGCNLLTLIRMYKYKGIPVPIVRVVTKQILIGLEYLHKCNIIHTDLKPENVLLAKTPNIVQINNENEGTKYLLPRSKEEILEVFGDGCYRAKIVDLGNACWTFKHYTDDVQTRQYRSPEVILGSRYDTPIDIWSMGCMVFELLTGDLLFEPKSGRSYTKNDDHLAQMIELLGTIPKNISTSGKHASKYFNRKGDLLHIKKLKSWRLIDVLKDKYQFPEEECIVIENFLLPMINYYPHQRATATESLNHPWLKDIDVNDFSSVYNNFS
jgi:serine/threonine-protein kinase SRPK3